MPLPAPDTDELLNRTAAGDDRARGQLLERHRKRLKRMVAVRMDPRLASRADPSDVVQEALAEAAAKLDTYLRERPLPFYPWLRRIAWERLLILQRRHLHARRRSVDREEPAGLPASSALELAERLCAPGPSPSQLVRLGELRERVRAALEALPERDREVLVLRYLEGLSNPDAAGVLGITPGAMRVRHVRAMERLRGQLGEDLTGPICRATKTGSPVGILRCMSPEQALAKRVAIDQRTGVCSLADRLYELLAWGPLTSARSARRRRTRSPSRRRGHRESLTRRLCPSWHHPAQNHRKGASRSLQGGVGTGGGPHRCVWRMSEFWRDGPGSVASTRMAPAAAAFASQILDQLETDLAENLRGDQTTLTAEEKRSLKCVRTLYEYVAKEGSHPPAA